MDTEIDCSNTTHAELEQRTAALLNQQQRWLNAHLGLVLAYLEWSELMMAAINHERAALRGTLTASHARIATVLASDETTLDSSWPTDENADTAHDMAGDETP